jgi:phenylacetate-CoA ligase
MPLIRYDVGDFVTLGGPCACGKTLPVLERIVGRARSTIRLPSGERIWPRYGSNVLGGMFPIRQFRLRQVSVTELVLEMVPVRRFGPADEERLRAFVLGTLGYPFSLVLRYVEDIPRSPGGKFEDVISEIP